MPYLVYAGTDTFQEADDLGHALGMAQVHLDSADDFARRMGWAPYWAEAVEIRKIKVADWNQWFRFPDEIVSRSTVKRTATQIRKQLGMAPCPASRPCPPHR